MTRIMATPARARAHVRAARREAYRELILDAADDLFREGEYERVKMSEIAEAAGVAKGTLYNYFDSKEAVFGALAQRWRECLTAELEQAVAGKQGIAAFRSLLCTALKHVEDNAEMINVYAAATGLAVAPAADPGKAEGERRFTALGRRFLQEAVDAGELRGDLGVEFISNAVHGMTHMVVERWRTEGQPAGLADQAALVMELFLSGARR